MNGSEYLRLIAIIFQFWWICFPLLVLATAVLLRFKATVNFKIPIGSAEILIVPNRKERIFDSDQLAAYLLLVGRRTRLWMQTVFEKETFEIALRYRATGVGSSSNVVLVGSKAFAAEIKKNSKTGSCYVILGGAGSGKTYTVASCCEELFVVERDEDSITPVVLSLKTWRTTHASLESWLEISISETYQINLLAVREMIRKELLIFFFEDGDLLIGDAQVKFNNHLAKFRAEHNVTSCVFSVRAEHLSANLPVQSFEILTLTHSDIHSYVSAFAQDFEQAQTLLHQNEELGKLCERALFLKLFVRLWNSDGDQFRNRMMESPSPEEALLNSYARECIGKLHDVSRPRFLSQFKGLLLYAEQFGNGQIRMDSMNYQVLRTFIGKLFYRVFATFLVCLYLGPMLLALALGLPILYLSETEKLGFGAVVACIACAIIVLAHPKIEPFETVISDRSSLRRIFSSSTMLAFLRWSTATALVVAIFIHFGCCVCAFSQKLYAAGSYYVICQLIFALTVLLVFNRNLRNQLVTWLIPNLSAVTIGIFIFLPLLVCIFLLADSIATTQGISSIEENDVAISAVLAFALLGAFLAVDAKRKEARAESPDTGWASLNLLLTIPAIYCLSYLSSVALNEFSTLPRLLEGVWQLRVLICLFFLGIGTSLKLIRSERHKTNFVIGILFFSSAIVIFSGCVALLFEEFNWSFEGPITNQLSPVSLVSYSNDLYYLLRLMHSLWALLFLISAVGLLAAQLRAFLQLKGVGDDSFDDPNARIVNSLRTTFKCFLVGSGIGLLFNWLFVVFISGFQIFFTERLVASGLVIGFYCSVFAILPVIQNLALLLAGAIEGTLPFDLRGYLLTCERIGLCVRYKGSYRIIHEALRPAIFSGVWSTKVKAEEF
ncbi:MAG: hypothetical protein QG574_4293 [Cyanobacteriota bacterium erpe_2018_sw_21hr_WHONDRS-SW48-000092_B_bin.40]|jgi:hypothetical protein|nr:hypothetical protein [Cyanobacteriota bacterium erpe_2018_sw_21hr_WHONDRS-SW48-000092_B_bin.40]